MERFDSIEVTVKITGNSWRGMTRKQLEKLCARLVRCANAGSTVRTIHAWTEPSGQPTVNAHWWAKE